LPFPLPTGFGGSLTSLLAKETKNSERVVRFYSEQTREFERRNDRKIDVKVHLLEDISKIFPDDFDAIIMPDSFYTTTREAEAENDRIKRFLDFVREALKRGKFIMGVCFGHQGIGAASGEYPVPYLSEDYRTIKYKKLTIVENDPILEGVPRETFGIFNHRYHLENKPEGATVLMHQGPGSKMAAFRLGNAYGFQFTLDYTPEELENMVKRYTPEAEKNGYNLKIPAFLHNNLGESAVKQGVKITQNFLKIATD
jgi:GMP synthase-like glutamine amidotransferase